MSDKTDKSIIRVRKDRDNPYTMINTRFLSDDRMSWKAKGLLTYLLSKPDNWQVRVTDLIKRSPDGKTAVYSGLNELKKIGYLEKYPVYENGKIKHWESVIYETPIEVPEISINDQDNPETIENTLLPENLKIENLNIENRDYNKYRDIINTDLKTTTPKKAKPVVVSEEILKLKSDIDTKLCIDFDVNVLNTLVNQKDIATVRYYLDNFTAIAPAKIESVAGAFKTMVLNGYTKKSMNNSTKDVPQMSNYEQREYDDEFYKGLYNNFD